MELVEKIHLLNHQAQEKLLEIVNDWLNNGSSAEDTADELEDEAMPYKNTLYLIKLNYTVEDIKSIVHLFPKNKKWTCDDLENEAIFPPDLTVKIQLINYKIYIMPRPSATHQEILGNVFANLNLFVRQNKLGKTYPAPFGVHLDEGTCLEPDVVLVLKSQVDKITEKGIYEVPALVIEVISKANYKKLREAKKEKYAGFGIAEYWEIYPKKKQINVEVLAENEDGSKGYALFSSASKQGKIQSKVLEGFELVMEDVFEVM